MCNVTQWFSLVQTYYLVQMLSADEGCNDKGLNLMPNPQLAPAGCRQMRELNSTFHSTD